VRADALEIVLDVRQWHLAGAGWQQVERVLNAMAASLAAGDRAALSSATAALELASPRRIILIGAESLVPPAPEICYRLSRLVHLLGGTAAAGRREIQWEGTDDDDVARY